MLCSAMVEIGSQMSLSGCGQGSGFRGHDHCQGIPSKEGQGGSSQGQGVVKTRDQDCDQAVSVIGC